MSADDPPDVTPASLDDLSRHAERATSEPLTILVVDDEPAVRIVVSRLLMEAGYRVVTAMSGAEAISTARTSGPVHVLLTDLRMPVMNGVELTTHIHAIHPDARVLIMAAYPSDDALDYPVVVKPFKTGEIEKQIGELLAHRQEPDAG